MTYATLGTRQQWHRHGGEGCQTDPDPAGIRVVAGSERAQRLNGDVRSEQRGGDADRLLREQWQLSA